MNVRTNSFETRPKSDISASTDFLKKFAPEGPWVLTCISPFDQRIETCTFYPEEEAEVTKWLDQYAGQRNIYFSVNPVINPVKSKAKREDIRGLAWLHVDIDARHNESPDEVRERALKQLANPPAKIPAPTVIVNSGGGIQAFWRLTEEQPINGDPAKYEHLKRYNQQIEATFEGDNCHNVDRIMRLPGTINVPNEKKLKKGRIPVLATLIEFNDNAYPLTDFIPAPKRQESEGRFPGAPKVEITGNFDRLGSVEELPESVPNKCKIIIAQGEDPDDPERFKSDSECVFYVICELVRHATPDEMIFSVLTDPDFRISRHILKHKNAERYAIRQIERAKAVASSATSGEFESNGNGKIINDSQRNIRLALERLEVALSYDEFADRAIISGLSGFGPAIDDAAVDRLWLLIDEKFRFRPSKEFFHTVVSDHARQNCFHPLRDYLNSLQWDGENRLDGWLSVYGGADDTAYTRAVGALVLVAAVRRIRQPGAKFDEMLVLESEQGTNKSSALRILAVEECWFTDDIPLNVDAKRVIEALSGKWIAEAGELKGLKSRGGGSAHLKSFLSRTHDKARMAYDRREREVPRQCIIVGTTNDGSYLRDQTGNRRFWPVMIDAFDLNALRRDRDQLWAEAAARETDGASIRLDPALWDAAAEQQRLRTTEDPFYERLYDMLGVDRPGKIKAQDVWTILGEERGRDQDKNERMGDAMKRLGFQRLKLRFGSDPVNGYRRGEGPLSNQVFRLQFDEHGKVTAVGYVHPDPY